MAGGRSERPVTTGSGMLLVLCLVLLSGVFADDLLFLGLNQECKNGTEPWTCKPAKTCKGLKNGLEKDGGVKLCNFINGEAIICCPPQKEDVSDKTALNSANPDAGKKAEQKCQEYSQYVYKEIVSPLLLPGSTNKKVDECAVTAETLIVGGSPAKLNEFPHMALIGKETKGSPLWFCGGSLISPNFVLTAAHCNITEINGTVIVRLGELDVLGTKDNARPIDVKVAQVINHPMYQPSKSYHDIALLKLEKEVELGPSIRPICLQTTRAFKHDKAIASGWGYTSFGTHLPSSILQKVLLDIVDDDKCVTAYGTRWPKVPKGIEPDLMMCCGGVPGKDTCQGDSGGPLQVALKKPYCMYSQIGITAFGIGCGSTVPGVYTRVSNYVPWIENIVWP